MKTETLSPIESKSLIGFSVALVVLLIVGGMSVLFLRQTQIDNQAVNHTHDVIEQLQNCFTNEREIGVRAREYVLTGKESFLRYYQEDIVRLDHSIHLVQELTLDNPAQQSRIQTQLRPLIDRRLAIIARAITARQQSGEQQSIEILLQKDALALIDQIRQVVSDMQQAERNLLHDRMAAHAKSSGRLLNVILLGSTIAIIFVGIASLQIHRDVVARRLVEENLRASEARLQLQTAELLSVNKELESFSYSVSHDLRAPLRGIEGFSELIRDNHEDRLDAEGKEYFNRICAATKRMGILIDEILNLSRIIRIPLEFQQVDLSAITREIVEDFQKANPERQVTWVIPQSLPVRGDPALLQIALVNLVGNAWKFTAKRADAKIELGSLTQAGETVYYIRDNGAGFDMAYQNKLFQAFQRLHSVREFSGSGIGLATVQRVVRRHNGRIWAEGTVGEGAVFFFTLHP